MYWALVHDGTITLKTLWIHAINSFVVCIDILTSCYEIRLMHYAYVLAFGVLYIIWTVIRFHAHIQDGHSPNNRYIYSAIDWRKGNEGQVRATPSHKSAHHLARSHCRKNTAAVWIEPKRADRRGTSEARAVASDGIEVPQVTRPSARGIILYLYNIGDVYNVYIL